MKTGQAQEFSMDDVLESIRRIISDGDMPAQSDKGVSEEPAISRGFLEGFEQAARTVSLADPEEIAAPRAEVRAPHPAVMTPPPEAAAPERAAPLRPAAPRPAERPALAPRPVPALRGTREPSRSEPVRSEPVRAEPARAEVPAGRLLSREAESAIESAFGSLNRAVVSRQPQTIEDIVRELMRPMVSAWLDRNLPSLVERLVEAEIERLSRRD